MGKAHPDMPDRLFTGAELPCSDTESEDCPSSLPALVLTVQATQLF